MQMVAWEQWIGVRIGKKYSIEKLLGADSEQASFLASSLSGKAVVTFFPAEDDDSGWPSYLLHLRHPQLRLILGAGEESIFGREWRCIAMEPADNLLSSRLAKEGPLPTAIARQLTVQLIDALQYL